MPTATALRPGAWWTIPGASTRTMRARCCGPCASRTRSWPRPATSKPGERWSKPPWKWRAEAMLEELDSVDDVLAIRVSHKITGADLEKIMDRLDALMARHEKVNVFEIGRASCRERE